MQASRGGIGIGGAPLLPLLLLLPVLPLLSTLSDSIVLIMILKLRERSFVNICGESISKSLPVDTWAVPTTLPSLL
jgi:hypothetical protein